MEGRFRVNRQSPAPLVRRQSSLEDVLSFTLYSPEPTARELTDAQFLYHELVRMCENDSIIITPPGETPHPRPLAAPRENPGAIQEETESHIVDEKVYVHKLFESLWEFCPTVAGRHNIVRMVLVALFAGPRDPNDFSSRSLATVILIARQHLSSTATEREVVNNTLKLLAEELLASLFLPLKAQGHCTPAVTSYITPTSRSEVGSAQATSSRLRNLRSLVLARDGSSCVVTGIQDKAVMRRSGRRRATDPPRMKTEVAHIIPHSLNAVDTTGSLPAPKHTVWRVLNLFDPGISQTLEGPLIDTPANALLLVAEFHERFGALEAYFEEIEGASNHYRFVIADEYDDLGNQFTVKDQIIFVNHEPVGTLRSQLPSLRLLRLHRACTMILNMSGAAGYIERLLDDAEELMVKGVLENDGSSDIGIFLRMRGLCEDVEEGFGGRVAGEGVAAR